MRWVKIDGFPDYMVCDDGRVKTLRSRKIILKPSIDRGYHKVTLFNGVNKLKTSIHRLVALAFVHKPDGMYEVNHIDGNKSNNHYLNLEWTDRKGNVNHMDRLGLRTFSTGQQHWGTTLTTRQVIQMRAEYASGKTSYPKLSRKYGVSISSAQRIVTRKTRKYE